MVLLMWVTIISFSDLSHSLFGGLPERLQLPLLSASEGGRVFGTVHLESFL